MKFVYDDGGRVAAGFKGTTGDCVTRAIAIATGKPYIEVYNELNVLSKSTRKKSNSRTGIDNGVSRKYLESLGWKWHPTMTIGSGCKVHLREDELPSGVIIANVSKHMVTVIDGAIHDISDCSRDGSRCVYGYFTK